MVADEDQSIGTGGHAIKTPRVADRSGVAAEIVDGKDGVAVQTPGLSVDGEQFDKLEIVVRPGRIQMDFVKNHRPWTNRTRRGPVIQAARRGGSLKPSPIRAGVAGRGEGRIERGCLPDVSSIPRIGGAGTVLGWVTRDMMGVKGTGVDPGVSGPGAPAAHRNAVDQFIGERCRWQQGAIVFGIKISDRPAAGFQGDGSFDTPDQ